MQPVCCGYLQLMCCQSEEVFFLIRVCFGLVAVYQALSAAIAELHARRSPETHCCFLIHDSVVKEETQQPLNMQHGEGFELLCPVI